MFNCTVCSEALGGGNGSAKGAQGRAACAPRWTRGSTRGAPSAVGKEYLAETLRTELEQHGAFELPVINPSKLWNNIMAITYVTGRRSLREQSRRHDVDGAYCRNQILAHAPCRVAEQSSEASVPITQRTTSAQVALSAQALVRVEESRQQRLRRMLLSSTL
ncbi:hypothetical protein BAUCODRAFT_193547 [Baudoinia panamericana UAMH 10762]|uniref:Uncharacterized protein n=1 Tax=Baudoinia panamericana (strain UAMH 10762) TaxID=717646 RepID=M2M1V9_BAUPA|nr:uncharacterized protein BAUCODRAFT_193547 [Baudoinia panamericana UAMH 10762]EMD01038.1 hypothetical protein BAUCODRAFT_193547 [Baudoinia panamericana UAMH 10762]